MASFIHQEQKIDVPGILLPFLQVSWRMEFILKLFWRDYEYHEQLRLSQKKNINLKLTTMKVTLVVATVWGRIMVVFGKWQNPLKILVAKIIEWELTMLN